MSGFAQNTIKNYEVEWKKVEEATKQGLPQSALTEVNKIYQRAKNDKQDAQIVKALVKRLSLEQELKEEYATYAIGSLKEEIKSAKEPAKSILYALLAEAYKNQYESLRWTIMGRTTIAGSRGDDPVTWSVDDFMYEIGSNHLKSIEQEAVLKATRLEPLDAIITKGTVRNLRPTLFDLLAHKALDFFENEERNITQPAYAFEIDQPEAFADAATFVTASFDTRDTLSLSHKALLLYQNLLEFHLSDTDPAALLDTDLRRVSYVYQKSVHPDKALLYKQALERLIARYHANAGSAQASYLLAQWYYDHSGSYQPYGDTTQRFAALTAFSIADTVSKKYPRSEGGANLHNLKVGIAARQLSFNTEKVVLPGKPFLISVQYKNVSAVYFRVVKATERLQNISQTEGQQELVEALRKESVVRQWSQRIPDTQDYQSHRVEVKADPLSVGEYYLIASSSENLSSSDHVQVVSKLPVSAISFVTQNGEYFVLHRETGAPLEGVKVQLWQQRYSNQTRRYTKEKTGEYATDQNGYFKITRTTPQTTSGVFLELSKGDDRLSVDELQRPYPSPARQTPKDVSTLFFFTDRSIYRPAQTVYFKGILLNRKAGGTTSEIVTGEKVVVSLFDANGQKIDSIPLFSSDFGSVSGRFVLPVGSLNGQFRLEASGISGATHFSVEEYKRPKYKVEIAKPEAAYKVNDRITVSGHAKAFAGNNIDGAAVKYRVERVARFPYPWRFARGWWPPSAPLQVAHGETVTNAEGKFEVTFQAIPDKTLSPETDPVFDYVVYTDVTDGAGETRSAQQTVSAGYKSVLLTVQLPEKVEVDSLRQVVVKTANMNGAFLPAGITMLARKLTPEPRLIRNRLWERPDQFVLGKDEFLRVFPNDEYDNERDPVSWRKEAAMLTASGQTAEDGKWEVAELSRLSAGFYELEFVATTADGEEVSEKKVVEITDSRNNAVAQPQYIWGIASRPVEPGEKAVIKLGSSVEKLFVVQTIERTSTAGNERTYEFIARGSGLAQYAFNATEADRGGYGVSYLFIKDNRVHQFQDVVKVPWSNKDLEIHYGTFRDKTLPGSEETWTLTITGNKGEKVATELLAGMYDASLDEFRPHQWQKPSIWMAYMGRIIWNDHAAFGQRYGQQVSVWGGDSYRSFDKRYDELISLPGYGGRLYEATVRGLGGSRAARQEVALTSAPMAADAMMEKSVVVGYGDQERNKVTGSDVGEQSQPTQDQPARRDFRETAFFLPELRTQPDGSVSFTFKLPEALTKWKFQALSHTKDLALGYSKQEIVTQKELMVQPNIPRFVRVGDKIAVSTRVVNLSEGDLIGTARVSILDAATGAPLNDRFGVDGADVSFTATAGQSVALLFPVTVPAGLLKPVTVRISAKAGVFSDSEDNLLPVLTNQMQVTETLPLSLRGTGTRTFTFEKLLKSKPGGTLRNHALTVEYTGNPAWYAIQALPYLMEYPYDCAEQTWNRYYANALATHIANSSPRIEQVFKTWRDLDTSALMSNLQKNQELKSLLLEETPWVLAAKSEAEQKRNLALLFDLVRMKSESASALTKLQQMQRPEGAFPWFAGGSDDRFVTQYILSGIGHLYRLTKPDDVQQATVNQIAVNGLAYLDSKLAGDYDLLVKSKADLKKVTPSALVIQYFYMRSFFPEIGVSKQTKKAYEYYLSRLPADWTKQSKYLQAMTALTLSRVGNKGAANAIMKSLKETSIRHDELGTYWKNVRRSWWWQDAPIEQHALLVEAFEEVASDAEMADGIRTWLLTNKQTNRWESTKATAEACYALLLRGTEWLNDNPEVKIVLGARTVSSDDGKEAGTGYIKTTIEGADVNANQGTIQLTVSGPEAVRNRPSWGGAYWQYFENIDKITFSETPLKLKKQLFVESSSDRGPVLKEMAAGNEVKVGDKLTVRIVLSVDRDMEYVHMKDMLASGLEPINVLSSSKWQGGLSYYESTKDAATNFFFTYLPKGTYVFEYPLNVAHQGDFTHGVTTVQCMYAPEFTAHTEGLRLVVKQD